MADKNLFDRYLLALRKTPIDEKTEHTDRAALQDLLQAVADDIATGIAVQHEPRRVADKPFATGLKAADPAAAANAGAACGRRRWRAWRGPRPSWRNAKRRRFAPSIRSVRRSQN